MNCLHSGLIVSDISSKSAPLTSNSFLAFLQYGQVSCEKTVIFPMPWDFQESVLGASPFTDEGVVSDALLAPPFLLLRMRCIFKDYIIVRIKWNFKTRDRHTKEEKNNYGS